LRDVAIGAIYTWGAGDDFEQVIPFVFVLQMQGIAATLFRRPMLRLLVILLLLSNFSSAQKPDLPGSAVDSQPVSSLLVWSTTMTQPNRYVSAHGIRGFAGGYSEDGLEFWSFPLQIVSGYSLSFALPKAPTVSAISMLTSVEVDPLGVTRVYTATDFRVRERITTHAEDPGVLVRFTVEGRSDLHIQVRFQPSLNLMWPAGIGGQETSWDQNAKGFLLSEPAQKFRALISSPEATEHSETNNDRRGSDFNRSTALALEPKPCSKGRCATLVFAGQSEKEEEVHATTASLLRVSDDSAADDAKRFSSTEIVKVTTPDADANRAILWAQIALEQAWTCNARLGCAMVAGYGPSHGSRRPQYAWYFAGDGLLATEAFLQEGNYQRAADELDFLYRYQKPDDGMMWHELSQSAGFLNWAKDYPYMYVHVDITFDFLTELAEYARISGDQALLSRHWPATLKAYQYCLSTLDKGDGLPRVPPDKMSGNEQDRLTDELTLSASWVRAAHAMSELAASMHDEALSRQAESASLRARESIRSRYWDSISHRWISGFTRSGKATERTSAADLAAIASGASTPEQTSATLDMLETPPYLTAWGLRSKPTTAPDYDPTGYAKGSVWAFSTAGAAEMMWQAHRPDAANALWQSLVPWQSADSLGHMHEVMSGSFFTPQRESVPEQTWSSSAFLSAAIHGMLGLESDGRRNVLHFEPQVPASWQSFQVEHVRVGNSIVNLNWYSENGHFTLDVQNVGPMFHLSWTQVKAGKDALAPATLERNIPTGNTHVRIP
jgi:glycogen debranching enzyme